MWSEREPRRRSQKKKFLIYRFFIRIFKHIFLQLLIYWMAFEEIIIITIQLEEKCECCLYGSLFFSLLIPHAAAAADKPEKKIRRLFAHAPANHHTSQVPRDLKSNEPISSGVRSDFNTSSLSLAIEKSFDVSVCNDSRNYESQEATTTQHKK